VLPRIGQPQAEHLEHAGRLMAGMPQSLIDAGREPFTARAVVYALLLCRDDPPARERQLQLLAAQLDPPLLSQTRQLAQALGSLPPASRLPLADLTVPALKRIGPQQYAAFRRVVEALSTAHGRPDLFEYCLRVVLLGYLDVQFGLRKPPAVRYRSVAAVAGPALTVLSSVAYAGPGSPDDIRRAVQAGAAVLAKADPQGERWAASAAGQPLPHEQCTLAAFDAALGQLAQAGAAIKRAVISALVATIGAEGKMTLEESELLRAVAAALACPVPPELPPAASR
jgi:hypothetical protein